MDIIRAFEQETDNTTTTENGAKAVKSTLCPLVDLFGSISASRENLSIIDTFKFAYFKNAETAVRILFNSRDIRGGQGERSVFKTLLVELAKLDPVLTLKLIPLVPEYGRWDDLWCLFETELRVSVLNFASAQLQKDLSTENPSLLAKWMPSCNTSSKTTKNQSKLFMKYLNMKEKEYRLMLSDLRKKIDIVERKICEKNFKDIDYSKLPSRAGLVHRKTFAKFDYERYSAFVSPLCILENKINVDTLYPYDIVKNILSTDTSNIPEIESSLFDAMWKNLPNYMEEKPFKGLVVADVSGSMFCDNMLPISVSISLAMYISEKNKGIWQNKFITFSESPQMQSIEGENIIQKVNNLKNADWGMNTDLIAVFDTILDAALKNDIAQKDMPKKLIIVSDMQFDQACRSNKRTNFEQIKKKYSQKGYNLPDLIFWNVNAKSGTYPMKIDDTGTCIVSGCSPVILKSLLQDKIIDPVEVMTDTVYNERYQPIGDVFHELG